MAKFGINDILNAKTKAAGQQAQTEGYKEIYLSPYEVKAAQENTHQKLENIEELADSFLHVGQEQPTVLARVNGEYRIIDGHRRNAANILNLERGHKEYEKVLYRFMDMSEAMYELRLLAGNGYTQELTAYEKTRLVERTKAALIRAKEEDGLEIQGKMRDLVAAMINESSTNVARMDAINNNATPEIKEQLKEGNLGITAAYEAAKLDEDEQKEIAEKAAAGENVRAKEIAEKVAEKKAGDDYETPHPESITSLCYSCQKYKDCNVKTGTCQKCDQYINKAEAEKTDEQRTYLESIRRTRFKTLIITAHIDKAVEEIERRREAAGRGVEYKAFEMYFMQGMDYAEIAEQLDTGKNTPRRWVTGIINELSVLLWGIDEERVK